MRKAASKATAFGLVAKMIPNLVPPAVGEFGIAPALISCGMQVFLVVSKDDFMCSEWALLECLAGEGSGNT